MKKNNLLQRLQNAFQDSEDKNLEGFKAFDKGVAKLKEELRQKITVNTLDDVNSELDKFKNRIDLQPLIDSVDSLRDDFISEMENLVSQIDSKASELSNLNSDTSNKASKRSDDLNEEISEIRGQVKDLIESNNINLVSLRKTFIESGESSKKETSSKIEKVDKRIDSEVKTIVERIKVGEEKTSTIADSIPELKKELITRINNRHGGGNMNRQEKFNSVDYLTKYTDINWKAGTNVTFTVAENNQTKMVDITISATGGGGGTVRSINNVSTNTVAGSASGTDYVYLCSGTMTLTLPTAVGNSNLYTVKNVGIGVVTVDTTGGQTIDNDLTAVMPVRYTSIDLISDTANWNIT